MKIGNVLGPAGMGGQGMPPQGMPNGMQGMQGGNAPGENP